MASTTINPNILTIDIQKQILEGTQYGHGGIPSLFKIIPTEGKTIKQILSNEPRGVRAKFVGEYEEIPYQDARLGEATLNSKRIGTAIELSEAYVQNASVNIEEYLKQTFTDRIFDEIENQMIVTGTEKGTEPKSIQKLTPTANRTTSTPEGQALSFEDVMESYTLFTTNPKNKKNAFWMISKEAKFSVVDANGNEKLSFENIPEGADATLLGLPVYRSSLGIAKTPTDSERGVAYIIANRGAYGISMTNIRFTKIAGDTKQQIRGVHVYIGESYVDGKLLNPYAKISAIFAPEVKQASVTEQSIDEPKPVKRKATKIEKE
ncbi:phage major capsid protein [Bacillus wiedmannii]|uniref:phage major capsid protein n=1 Tax=Bacillus wiedmannii TaxID=1890302 RepID=UPI000BEB7606|nr:phage major capsid protein [Bacillus wiedmannii]PEF42408.1 phage major capsid protein [Bacillus wiedmannii]